MSDRPGGSFGGFPPPSGRHQVPQEPVPVAATLGPGDPDGDSQQAFQWRTNALLFVLTLISVFVAGVGWSATPEAAQTFSAPRLFLEGWIFAVPLLGILVCHEFGHYIAAKIHRVPASLPYFIPLPFLSPFGTMGAVIAMRGRIRSRNALLDIGAAGPIAGMVVAVPVLLYGLSLSEVRPQSTGSYIQEGQCLLYSFLKYAVHGPIPEGHDVYLHPTALAGWAGLLVTMINMLPWGQLDGGHIAYALFGPVQNKVARVVRYLLLPLFVYNAAIFFIPIWLGESQQSWGLAASASSFWLVWFVVLGVLGRIGGGRASEHPPTEPGELTTGRKVVAVGTLVMFVLLFMPTPWAAY